MTIPCHCEPDVSAILTDLVQRAVIQEREAIAAHVSTLGSESGYTHVEDLVSAICSGSATEHGREVLEMYPDRLRSRSEEKKP